MPRPGFAGLLLGTAIGASGARAGALPGHLTDSCRAHAQEAASRSGISSDVIMRVMQVESGGLARAVSPKGAMGCMQIMPGTWTYVAAQYRLGSDPFDARMNMIGGAMYLAELAKSFGFPGAYAAYNAGPARYIRYTANGVPLPAETVAYAGRLGGSAAPPIATISRVRWQEARLFLDRNAGGRGTSDNHMERLAAAPEEAGASPASVAAPPARATAATLFPLAQGAALHNR